MKFVRERQLKKGQIVIVLPIGELGVGKFEIAEIENITIHFKNHRKIDMDKGSMEEMEGGITHLDGEGTGMYVLNSEEVKKVVRIVDKMKMLVELEDKK